MVFEKELTDPNGIPGYRFVPADNVFGTPAENPENACFCNNANGVCDTPSGVFNVSACQFGSPVMLSWPHFFQADPKLLNAVEGLSPNKEKHQTSVDVQPLVGNGLGGRIRSQVNIKMSKINDPLVDRDLARGLRDILLPIVWFSDDLDKITDPKLVQKIKSHL
jgi:scavenger receptor class B protein 1